MSDQFITGKIHFSRIPRSGELEHFVTFLTRSAVENRIWINTGEQIRNPDARYKYSIDDRDNNNLVEQYLPFEITDSKETDECNRILSGIWYRDTDFSIADLGSSGLANIENFFGQIMDDGLIQYVQIAFDLVHGYTPFEYFNLDITAKDFCKTLMSLPNYNAVPTVQFNIRK